MQNFICRRVEEELYNIIRKWIHIYVSSAYLFFSRLRLYTLVYDLMKSWFQSVCRVMPSLFRENTEFKRKNLTLRP